MNLYLDIGATNVKVLYDNKVTIYPYETKETINITDFACFMKQVLTQYPFHKLYTCSQMHGFYIEGEDDYVSWMCESGTMDGKYNLKNTGLYSYPGLPCYNVDKYEHVKNQGKRMCHLIDAILDQSYYVSHETLECGSGFYDVVTHTTTATPPPFVQHHVARYGPHVCGRFNGRPVYAPMGDMQAAVLGIDHELQYGDVIVNMGTGSQVSQLTDYYREDTENRPLFNYYLNCITHIPSGKSLQFYKELLHLPDLSNLEFEDIIQSKEVIILSLFQNMYYVTKDVSGCVRNITSNTTPYTLACSLIKCYVMQFIQILNDYFPLRNQIYMTGGIVSNNPVVVKVLQHYIHTQIIVEENDTLKGLKRYSEYNNGDFWFNR